MAKSAAETAMVPHLASPVVEDKVLVELQSLNQNVQKIIEAIRKAPPTTPTTRKMATKQTNGGTRMARSSQTGGGGASATVNYKANNGRLTERGIKILHGLIDKKTPTAAIAEKLGITPPAVLYHRMKYAQAKGQVAA